MEFIQLGYSPGNGIPTLDSYCFGLKVPDPNEEHEEFHMVRYHPESDQNDGTGWYTNHAHKMSFRLILKF